MKYPEIIPQIKSEQESITNGENPIGYSILDFWKWSMSNLLSNATRGVFAEFIVLTSIGYNKSEIRDEWDAYDLKSIDEKIKIEVKSASYIQSWEQKNLSNISFNIKESKITGKREADKYVFCILKHLEQDTINPSNLDQWEFYVIKTEDINNKLGTQKTVSLSVLQKIAVAINYNQLHDAILLD